MGGQLEIHNPLNGWPRFEKFDKSGNDKKTPEVLAGLIPCTTKKVRTNE
jgi:hypothetical protein